MLALILAPHALAQVPLAPIEADPVVTGCVEDPGCGAHWRTLASEALAEMGLALQHHPLGTSALASRGTGAAIELKVDSVPLGRRNTLARALPLIPGIPRLGAAVQLGAPTFEAPAPRLALGVHLLPPIPAYGTTTFATGAVASAAVPVHPVLRLGAELDWTLGLVRVPLVGDRLEALEGLADLLGRDLACEAPCTDRMVEHAAGLRLGVGVEPLPALFLYARAGAVLLAQDLHLAVDDSHWRQRTVLPQAGVGGGARVADRVQLTVGLEQSLKPAALTSDERPRVTTQVIAGTSVRFGPMP